VRCPALECAARQTANLPSEIRVCQYWCVEVGAVCAPSPRTQAGVRIQALGSSEDIPQHYVQVRASLRAAGLGASLNRIPSPFPCADEDCMVGRRSRRIGLVRGVDVSADRLVENIESVQLVDSTANLRKGFLQGVGAVTIV